jgi:hypothetical protein
MSSALSHHFSHHSGVTGWTSRLRLGLCFRLVSTARYDRLPAQSLSHGGSRRFNPYNAHSKGGGIPKVPAAFFLGRGPNVPVLEPCA